MVKKVKNGLYMNVWMKSLLKYGSLVEFVSERGRGEMLDVGK